ncbi:MAG: sigma-54-dependent Fis family transcriptional regulator [Lentisphaeraceae bacterium]|nr:sigma-54-dependent Fis family transcriptional regulator [Lentisphaeraceae bacterium]
MKNSRLNNQCSLYRLLLHPDKEVNTESECIEKALNLVTEIVDARLGYIEFYDSSGKSCWAGSHCNDNDVELIRSQISGTIISEALSTGKTIVSPSAILDDRFNQANSVITGKIESVLCSPIKCDGLDGVIYLQGDLSGLCCTENVDEAELFSQHIQPLLKRLKYNISKVSPEDDLRKMYDLEGIIGNSTAFKKVLNEAMTIAPLDVCLLMNGETGTGKTHIAKIIHQNSSRKNHPFIHINCANVPESLFESELFGAAKGAFSGATNDISGKIYAANKGTLFLDEISEMPVSAQAKLLQFLEEGFYYPLGSNTKVEPNVRVIVASNANFQERIAEGSFREDLYYRIANFPIVVPPLRERISDLEDLIEYFVKATAEKLNLGEYSISDACINHMKFQEWPGNIRELQNKIQQGIIKAKISNSLVIEASHIFDNLPPEQDKNDKVGEVSFSIEKTKWEKKFIEVQLVKNLWNVTRTAASLKMSRSHLNRLIREYSLKKPN